MFQQLFADFAPWSTPINHRLRVSAQMRPTQLALPQRIAIIRFRSIAADDAGVVLS